MWKGLVCDGLSGKDAKDLQDCRPSLILVRRSSTRER
jgi:hypothetical protein